MVEHGQSVQINPGEKMFRKMQINIVGATFKLLRLLLAVTIWLCYVLVAPGVRLCHGLAAAPRPQDGVFRRGLNKPSNPRTLEPLNPSGFTLIELIAVMIVVGILAATVLPRIDFGTTSSRASVDGAVYVVASDIRYAQEFAMANRISKSIVFTNGSSTYTFNPVSTGMDPSGQLQSIGATIGTTVTFTFNSLGEPTSGGGNTVTVSRGGQSRTITVLQYTGKVNIS
jgi:prepilin-type N-terminal cleavage/methylation domain-containing protein